MSSNTQKSTSAAPKPAQLQTTAGPNNPNLRLEKVAARTTTPDSEALASSDDEGDQRLDSATGPAQLHKPARRSSWLNDTSHPFASPRKASLPTNSLSPTTSNPTTPSGEPGSGPWGSQSTSIMGRTSGSAAYPWGTGIWNAERKEAPSRLSEVLPSPTSTGPMGMGNGGFFSPESNLSPGGPGSRDPATNAPIPFAIPLHPTPKTYRSQSYSVGQLEPEATSPGNISAGAHLGRSRHPGLQHRPSRPSMLSEMSNDGTMLGKVKEVEDDEDDESLSESMQGSFHQSSESKTIEMLTRENAMLRQQQQYSHRMRPRAPTGGSAYMGNGYSPVPEESDYAVDELDEMNDSGESFARRAANRRMSEYGSGPMRSPIGLESRKTDNANLKKALWSTTLGFPVGDISQSRRHSFANMPTRQGSISSIADSASVLEGSTADLQNPQDYAGAYGENQALSGNGTAAAYFGGPNLANAMPTTFTNPFSTPFNMPQQYANRAPSPHRNVYGMGQPRHNQLLHIVLFKCARADVFYIQEGTGLTVKPGDLVIVEADRGTDLGTVGKDNVDWQTAKELKEHYAEEQYKWLMMYSQGAAAAQEGSGAGLLASSGLQGSTVGGMGPPNQHHMQEPNAGELRPKLIKRLAQSHEVQALRDKEGQEAKAKRVCMQKVKEHGLNMEILDAEFQMDWKKLTFYYFADAYINFNSLVTDLFKIYKTRIWMSAINPASFASPTLGIQAPSGIGPGAVGVGRSSGGGERRYNAQMQQQQQQSQQVQEQQAQAYGAPGQGGRGFRPAYNQGFGADRNAPNSGYPPSNYGLGPAGIFGNGRGSSYVAGVVPISEAFGTGGYPQQVGDFQSMQQRFPPGSIPSPTPRSQGVSPISPQSDWTGAFQGLSLNTH